MPLAHTIRYVQRGIILVSINLIQLNRYLVNICQSLTTKEIRSRIRIAQHRLVLRSNHRSKLRQVANHQQLHTASAVPMMGTELEELQKGNDSDVKPNVMLDFLPLLSHPQKPQVFQRLCLL